jgi:pimeloyl-ACP methyl ester carboxylesterase
MSDSAPTVVLVHGAFADASSFARVIPELLADEVPVVAPAVPNRSLAGDAAYIASVVGQIDGPVVLVGHSYGGAVITVAGVEDNVKALVYLAGYALGEGESLGELQGRFPDSDLAAALVTKPSPPKARSPAPTCTWTSRSSPRSSLLTSTRTSRRSSRCPSAHSPQRRSPSPPPRRRRSPGPRGGRCPRRTTPNPDVERFGYQRAGATTVEIDSSHLVMLSHPKQVADLIGEALRAVGS